LGRLQTASGANGAAAARAFQKACDLVEARLPDAPHGPLRAALVRSYTFLGVLQQKNHQKEAALRSHRKAAALVRGLRGAPPADLGDRADYGQACYVLAAALRLLGHEDEALPPARQAVLHLQAALDTSPANGALRKQTSDAYFELGELQRRLKQPSDA